ncbi:hypothetical protein [Telmatospirillum sp.]|uniref:hypothetical protein n=1 Tax=Telmatospirillum sp. TaxID=2079197 RepID=UPI00283BE815|nr:hypothetical protein [Telmatospirillum sp.]MDR3436380.1 hypothetical protein [Telmatospirillum sp.]
MALVLVTVAAGGLAILGRPGTVEPGAAGHPADAQHENSAAARRPSAVSARPAADVAPPSTPSPSPVIVPATPSERQPAVLAAEVSTVAPGGAGKDALLDVLHFGQTAPDAACRQATATSVGGDSLPAADQLSAVGKPANRATSRSTPSASSPRPGRAVEPSDTETGEHIFQIQKFGRYSVAVTSPQGTAVQLVDRMAGPEARDGEVGERDGRLDLFFGPGDHKAILTSMRRAKTPPVVSVRPFDERNGPVLPRLVELSSVETDLADLQQRSYWLRVERRRTVFIEAAGRHLADLRLWKDGSWLVDAAPDESISEPANGKPLEVRRLVAKLDPGLYLLIAYGGVGQTWSETGTEQPFYLRWGIPSLPENGRRRFVAGPFGYDRWLVPKTTNAFRVELPQPGVASLEVAPFNDGNFTTGKLATIDKKNRSRSVNLLAPSEGAEQVVTVAGLAGLPYVLQTYVADREYSFDGAGDYLVGTLGAGHGEDDPDHTAVLTQIRPRSKNAPRASEQIIAARTIELGQSTAWHRRFNLLDPVTLFLGITEPGRYRVEGSGVDAEYTLTPLFVSPDIGRPAAKIGGGEWDLDAGVHVLTIMPRPQGRGVLSLALKGAAAGVDDVAAPAVLGASFLPVHLDPGSHYRLYSNRAPTGPVGAVVRKLPADIGDDVPLIVEPCQTLSLPVSVPGAGLVQALTENGTALPVSLDGKDSGDKVSFSAGGVSRVAVANPLNVVQQVSLHFTPEAAAQPPLPAVSTEDLAKVPDFPKLETGAQRFLDLDRDQSSTFVVKVDKPALYQLESTGRLQTSGTIRTQVQPSLDRAEANGIGRNFLLQQYLREGLYQLSVATQGRTMGHLGVTLAATPVQEGGPLTLDVAAHASLAAGRGLAYDLEITHQGLYRLRTLTVNGPTRLRVEDAGGWPLTTPDQMGEMSTTLAPGRYRVVVLPQVLTARVQTLVEEVTSKPGLSGHGPHPLALETTVDYRWEEPAAGGRRTPDTWTFTLSAAADLTVALSDLMQADLTREGDSQPLSTVTFRKPWQGRLEAGRYRLDVASVRPNNHFDYHLTTALRQLVAGQERRIDTPAVVPISLAGGRLVEISSFGDGEVRGTLLDETGAIVARAIDRPEDWNFNIIASPPAGNYRLKVDSVGINAMTPANPDVTDEGADQSRDGSAGRETPSAEETKTGSTVIRLRQFDEVEEPPLALSSDKDLVDGRLHSFPLEAPSAAGASMRNSSGRY